MPEVPTDTPHMTRKYQDLDKLLVGVDEVGYGAWAGPVVVGCAAIDRHNFPYISEIQDSKQLSPTKRRRLARLLISSPHVNWSVGYATAHEIDQLSLGKATFVAIERALERFPAPIQSVIIDGVRAPKLPWPTQTLIQGDTYHVAVGAASIIAKVMRDAHLDILHTVYPQFCWHENKGYGTAKHRKAITHWGLSPHHRASYKPLKPLKSASRCERILSC